MFKLKKKKDKSINLNNIRNPETYKIYLLGTFLIKIWI